MDQPTLEGKQTRKDLKELIEPSVQQKGQECSNEGKEGYSSDLSQPYESFLVGVSLQDILFENVGEEGEGGI